MFTIAEQVEHEIEPIKRSRFIACASPVSSEAAAQRFLAELRERFDDARHHCSAWRLMNPAIERANDDGEPSGSAGRPILAQLAGRELTDVAVVVVRYFGGTKLGVGGLVRAYARAAGESLDRCSIVAATPELGVEIDVGYPDVAAIERVIAALDGRIANATYLERVTLAVTIDERAVELFCARVADATGGRASVSYASAAETERR